MDSSAFIWHERLADFDLGEGHPLSPVRLTLTVALMEAYGILRRAAVLTPKAATYAEIQLVHSVGYIEAVHEASDWGAGINVSSGLGTEDNPIYPGMHELAALNCGATLRALREVALGPFRRAFSIAGGMHHAHRSRAAGFSVYNDAAVAIAALRDAHPATRVLYIDLDAHHGDGVQEAFYSSRDVMTISLHQTGLTCFPGTGFAFETGYGAGEGYSVNVAMPSGATDACFARVYDEVVAPLAQAFRPEVIVAQVGVDGHYKDPETDLGLTLSGYRALVDRVIATADATSGGHIVLLGGGGYHAADVVPLAWTWVLARALGIELAEELPQEWRELAAETLGSEPPRTLGADDRSSVEPEVGARLLAETDAAIDETKAAVFGFHHLA